MQEGAPQWSWGEHRHAKTHVAISPVEAGIRAGELRNLAFPCKYTVACLNSLPMKSQAFSYRCGDSARLGSASRLTPGPNRPQSTINVVIIRQRPVRGAYFENQFLAGKPRPDLVLDLARISCFMCRSNDNQMCHHDNH